jgi:hypothetical protein
MWMFLLPLANATQSVPAADFGGTWDLWCESAAVSLDIGLTVGGGAAQQSASTTWSADLPCAASRRDLRDISHDVAVTCLGAGIARRDCRELGQALNRQLQPLRTLGTTLMPIEATLSVGETQNPFAQILGVYPVYGTHTWLNGYSANWDYLLDANDGPTWGHLASFGIAAGPGAAADALACTALNSAAVDAWLDPVSNDLQATWAQDQRLVCAGAGSSGAWLALTIGVQVDGEMGGSQR